MYEHSDINKKVIDKMSKKNTEVTLSQVELSQITQLNQRRAQTENMARQALGQIDNEMKNVLDLVKDRHGVDLTSGEYSLDQDGRVTPLKEEGEAPKPEAQQLNG